MKKLTFILTMVIFLLSSCKDDDRPNTKNLNNSDGCPNVLTEADLLPHPDCESSYHRTLVRITDTSFKGGQIVLFKSSDAITQSHYRNIEVKCYGQYRVDYLFTQDKKWIHWYLVNKGGDTLYKMSRYDFKKCHIDSFTFRR